MKIRGLLFFIAICLAFTASKTFAQCGADGTQPCPPKTDTKKTLSSTQTAAQKRAAQLAVQREAAERQRILRERLRRKQLAKKTAKPEMPQWMKNVAEYAAYLKNAKVFELFPVVGITLGETGSTYLSLSGQNCGVTNADGTQTGCYNYKNIYFYTDENNVADSLYFSRLRFEGMPEEWKKLGFDFDLSVNEWKALFKQQGYNLTALPSDEPKVVTQSGKKFLKGELSSLIKLTKGTAVIRLNFNFGIGKTTYDDKGSLFSILVDKSN